MDEWAKSSVLFSSPFPSNQREMGEIFKMGDSEIEEN
jgi:hypothetical protein